MNAVDIALVLALAAAVALGLRRTLRRGAGGCGGCGGDCARCAPARNTDKGGK